MIELLTDLNTLTNIPEKSLMKLVNLADGCISTSVWESLQQDLENITEINIGIGILTIKYCPEDSLFKYRFTPSDILRRQINKLPECSENPLKPKLMTSLQNKFLEVYKDIC